MPIAIRRSHVARLKRRASLRLPEHRKHDPRQVGKAATTPKSCKCMFCVNPRKDFGRKTIQERRLEQSGLIDGADSADMGGGMKLVESFVKDGAALVKNMGII